MENGNFWDWDNGEEHSVSAVYRDTEAGTEDAGTQSDVPRSDVPQSSVENSVENNAAVQSTIVQNNMEQNTTVKQDSTQTDTAQNLEMDNGSMQKEELHNANIEHMNDSSVEAVAESNFILVGNPQNPIQSPAVQSDTSFVQTTQYQKPANQQTRHQETGYQQTQPQEIGYQQTQYQETGYQQTQYQETGYQQSEYQQTQYQQDQQNNFQQIIPINNTQQNQGTKNQKGNRNQNTDYSANFDSKDISENKVSAMAAYLLGPVGIIIALLIARDSAYTAFHVRQALKLTVCSVALEIIAAILALFGMIPLVGIIFKLVLVIICIIWLGVLVLRLIAIAQVCDGEAREPAIVGKMKCFH
jgi:Predicted membrane protein